MSGGLDTSPARAGALVALAAVLAAATYVVVSEFAGSGGGGGEWKKPGFCGRLDCPEFTTWQKEYDFQIREYKEATWVATNVTALKYKLAVKMAIPLLNEYFWGANNESLRLKEAVPLTIHYRTDLHPHMHEVRNYTVAMFLPYNYQDNPPQPNNTAVFLYCNPKAALATRGFQHHPREWRVIEESRALMDALSQAGHDDVETGEVMVASYDNPTKHQPRRHRYRYSEVWLRGNFKNATLAPAGHALANAGIF